MPSGMPMSAKRESAAALVRHVAAAVLRDAVIERGNRCEQKQSDRHPDRERLGNEAGSPYCHPVESGQGNDAQATREENKPETEITAKVTPCIGTVPPVPHRDREGGNPSEEQRYHHHRKTELVEIEYVHPRQIRQLREQPRRAPVVGHVVQPVGADRGDLIRAQHVADRGQRKAVVMNPPVENEILVEERVLVDLSPHDTGRPD